MHIVEAYYYFSIEKHLEQALRNEDFRSEERSTKTKKESDLM